MTPSTLAAPGRLRCRPHLSNRWPTNCPHAGSLAGAGVPEMHGRGRPRRTPGLQARQAGLLRPVGEVGRRWRGLSLCYEPQAAGLSEAVTAPSLERVSKSRIITSFHNEEPEVLSRGLLCTWEWALPAPLLGVEGFPWLSPQPRPLRAPGKEGISAQTPRRTCTE